MWKVQIEVKLYLLYIKRLNYEVEKQKQVNVNVVIGCARIDG